MLNSPRTQRAAPLLVTACVAAAVVLVSLENGGYSLAMRSSVAILLWWTLAVGAALALLPREQLGRAAWRAGGCLAGLAVWTAISIGWADSAERAFNEVNRVLLYLGVFAFVVASARKRDLDRWCDGLALGISIVATLALVSRLSPDFTSQAPGFFPSDRLSYPVNYWNGLAILTGLAIPLLLRAAIAVRPVLLKALAVLPIPALAATIFLTSSRGGAATAALGALVFLALAPRRIAALGALISGALGAAGAVAVLLARDQLVDGPLTSALARDQGRSAALLIALLCLGAALLYAAGNHLLRNVQAPKLRAAPRLAVVLATVAVLVVATIAVEPGERFDEFKQPSRGQTIPQDDYTRAHLVSASGSGRWQLWGSARDMFDARPVAGQGAGAYEAWWLQRGDLTKFVRDAHSLYLETLGELGLVGFLLLVGALGTPLVAGSMRLRAAREEAERSSLAALIGVLIAFAFAAAIDWMWELPIVAIVAVAVAALLVAARITGRDDRARPGPNWRRWLLRGAIVGVSLAAIVTEGITLATQERIERSRSAAVRGDGRSALEEARAAQAIQPWAASPRLQAALVQEQAGRLAAAGKSISKAIDNDRSDWRLWLVQARIDTRAGDIEAARRSLARARSLNPRSPVFSSQ